MLPKYNLRVKFPKNKQREFIEEVSQKSGFSIRSLSQIINVSPRTLRDWRRELFCMSEEAVNTFCRAYKVPKPDNIESFILNWQKIRLNICRKGGLARYKKYGNFSTPEGMKKGGSRTLAILRGRGILAPTFNKYLYPNKSEYLAEFVGIMLGDGGITNEQATITFNSVADKQYIGYVSSLGNKLFGQLPRIGIRKNCQATTLRYSGKKFIKYLTKIGLRVGDKVRQQVGVPRWIMNSTLYKTACLRGLMDTDGCIARCTHKRGQKKYIYLNPCFTNKSRPLLEFVTNTWISLGFHPSVAGRNVWLYNKVDLGRYFKIIRPNNFRLLKFKEGIPNGSGDGSLNHIA